MATNKQFYGTGRRKSAVARVFMRPGKGEISVNKRALDDYFPNKSLLNEYILCIFTSFFQPKRK